MAIHVDSTPTVSPPSDHGLSPIPRVLFLVAAAYMVAAPAVATVIVDTSGTGHHLATGHFVLEIPAAILSLSAVLLAVIARPGRVNSSLGRWIFVAVAALIAALVGLSLAPFISSRDQVTIPAGIAFVAAVGGLLAYAVAFVGAVITTLRSRDGELGLNDHRGQLGRQ